MSVGKYRDYASDVYFKSYLLLKKVHKDQGELLVFEIISLAITKDQNDPYIFESGIFAIKSLIDAFEKTSSPTQFSEFLR